MSDTLYTNTVKRLLETENKRISEKAVQTLKQELETHAETIRERSTELSDHAERKTITEKDVQQAIKHLNKE